MKVLFIGRFQPFHKGHLRVVQEASKKYDEVIIGIGSSQYSDTSDNPFTSEERELMIKKTLEKTDINNYRIISIPDIHNPPKWVDHVLSIVSDFDVVISNNSLTKRLFSEKDYNVKETPLYEKKKYSGREIRRRMINSEPWDDLVPTEVSNFIKDIDGGNRVKELSNK
ncbi:MAG: nicotinamide-nucleotide adenylyltransferase [Thermoplasmatales archaeon]|nr:nicotinamide-nucleotide adenylyltransferase [Thermoplasmatales archaeon]